MTKPFKPGDVVKVDDDYDFATLAGQTATVVENHGLEWPSETSIKLTPNERGYYVKTNALTLVTPTIDAPTAEVAPKTILVRFPGEEGAHELSVPDAYALFRALDRALTEAGS